MREDGLGRGFVVGQSISSSNIVLYDDLEGLFKWKYVAGSVGSSISKWIRDAYHGSACLVLQTYLAVPNGPARCSAERSLGYPKLGRYLFVCRWKMPALKDASDIEFRIAGVFNGYSHSALAYLLFPLNAIVLYYGSSGEYLLLDVSPGFLSGAWHETRIIVDAVRDEYVSVGIDGFNFDLQGYGLVKAVDVGPDQGRVLLGVVQNWIGRFLHLFDDVLVCYV